MPTKIGIMQGRLVPPEPGRFQAFPRERWQREFDLAASVPLDYIEWIYDAYGEDVNPLSAAAGLESLLALSRLSGITIPAVCADYFMDRPLLRVPEAEIEAGIAKLIWLLRRCAQIGVGRITLPFVDASRIETAAEEDQLVEALTAVSAAVREAGVEIHLESSLAPGRLARLLERLPDPLFRINYDSGNSASLGYLPREEFAAYGEKVGSVHIKDRVRGGGTVPLGQGDTDFASFFECLARIRYSGDFTLQVARGADHEEVEWIRRCLDFVSGYWPIGERSWTLV